MMWLKASLLLLFLVSTGAGTERKENPCTGRRECFSYTLVCTGPGYEARSYAPSVWVGTRVQGEPYLRALIKGFWRLFRYIQGRNTPETYIPMTAPVLARIGNNSESLEYTVYFLLPEAFQKEPPTPTEDSVFVEHFPELQVYARVFGGWMTDENRQIQLQALDGKLSEDGRETEAGLHYTAGYNSPMELFNRRNEVWRLVKGEIGCSPATPE
ncbi:heme-binding protein 2-like isoform X2 [Hemicordylus capensis]|uniref:heme-binding protein 2-like isoform X2 n=1 Tax=Hemicordylus capensis TaxID=884348 RepID=UPI002302A324|nr:heme-binding protein 2-like isoform X2 [Hemicordylus capensis]XP_053152924.1 heme-binding protein 2-like isoform X2 [Hemicordylus capensis]